MTRGVCLCGTVQYEFTAPFQTMLHCHCSMCRKHHGAAFATFVAAPSAAFRWIAGEKEIGKYQSSAQGARSYCSHCGSIVPVLMPEAGFAIAPAGNLEGDPGIRPQGHMFVGSKAPWYEITDAAQQHDAAPPELGGGMGVVRPERTPRGGAVGGSCLCGEVAYELRNPVRIYNCHCWRCRRGRSAAHASNLFVNLDDFTLVQGSDSIAQYKVPEARFFTVAFCTRCGGGAPRISLERRVASIPAGTLDTDPGIRPEAHIYVGSKAPWFEITDDITQYAEGPPPA